MLFCFIFQVVEGIRDGHVTGVQTCALPICVELKNKTLGVVGLGRIGVEVATRAMGQRMNVIAYDPFLTEEKANQLGIDYGTVEDVLKAADFITVHTPLLKETKHLINKEAFTLMKEIGRAHV